jgi:hypothetical protein
MKDLTSAMDTMIDEEEEGAAGAAGTSKAEEEFPGTEAAMKESEADAAARAAAEKEEAHAMGESVPGEERIGWAREKKTTGDGLPEEFAAKVTVEDEKKPAPAAAPVPPAASGSAEPRRDGQARQDGQARPALMSKEDSERHAVPGMTEEEQELRAKEKKKGLTKEQKAKMAALEEERRKVRQERVDTLAAKLLDRISIWTETDRGKDVTHAFEEKIRLEVENLKMESFGLEILHAVAQTYIHKGTDLLGSQKFFGIGSFFGRMKAKGTLAKDTWKTISAAIDAQMTMEELEKNKEKGGEEWTEEQKAEYERRVTGKILNAAWRGSKFEIQSVLRDVCDKILHDKKVKLETRLVRAEALVTIGNIYAKVSSISKSQTPSFIILIHDRHTELQKKKATTWPSRS